MIRALLDCFRPLTAERVAQRQVDEARVLHLQHAALAEEHAALAQMYSARVDRLTAPEFDPDFREVPRS